MGRHVYLILILPAELLVIRVGQANAAVKAIEISRRVKILPRLGKRARGDGRTRGRRFERGAGRERKSDDRMTGELIIFTNNHNSHKYRCEYVVASIES